MKALRVFDLQRFALHDGPGIRTTVFLKGCPLNCIWCHNPESKKMDPQLRYMETKCIGCRRCESVCEKGVHSFLDGGVHTVAFKQCIGCGRCVERCPQHALSIYGKIMTVEEILSVVRRDIDFYDRSGGGLTVSGGEPMMQTDGILELFKEAKREDIHVCLDTSGQAGLRQYQKIAPYVDLFLYDYKITDAVKHRKYTGVGNEQIMENLDWICKNGGNVILRCPIIPGINDKETHYQAIADLSNKYEAIREVHLMMYHDMAKGKVAQIGEQYALSEIKTIEEKEKYRIYSQVEACGCKKLANS